LATCTKRVPYKLCMISTDFAMARYHTHEGCFWDLYDSMWCYHQVSYVQRMPYKPAAVAMSPTFLMRFVGLQFVSLSPGILIDIIQSVWPAGIQDMTPNETWRTPGNHHAFCIQRTAYEVIAIARYPVYRCLTRSVWLPTSVDITMHSICRGHLRNIIHAANFWQSKTQSFQLFQFHSENVMKFKFDYKTNDCNAPLFHIHIAFHLKIS
jgi:hypothetical protein